jgi:hypothetical protein
MLNPSKILLFLSGFWFLGLFIAGCDFGEVEISMAARLYGSWRWVSSQGGWAGELQTPESTGQTRTAIFRSDGLARFLQNDSLVAQVRYSLESRFDREGNEYLIIRYLESEYFVADQEVAFGNRDTLYLTDTCIDCYYHVYTRIRWDSSIRQLARR